MSLRVHNTRELPEVKLLRQAEEMFAMAKKKAVRLGAILGILLMVWFVAVHRKPAERQPSVTTQVLFAAAVVAYGVGRAAVSLRHAKQYVEASRRALAEAEMEQGR